MDEKNRIDHFSIANNAGELLKRLGCSSAARIESDWESAIATNPEETADRLAGLACQVRIHGGK